jgi:hypothetical protein
VRCCCCDNSRYVGCNRLNGICQAGQLLQALGWIAMGIVCSLP